MPSNKVIPIPSGTRFGMLVVLGYRYHKGTWLCVCDCGTLTYPVTASLKKGRTRSCGCNISRAISQRLTTHGQSKTRNYKSFHQQKREAAKLHRTPRWADMELIRMFYEMCPDGMVVDHILPLQGTHISGLNVLGNLQYLTASENSRKRNKFTPYIEHASYC